jgi:hypothetical protein
VAVVNSDRIETEFVFLFIVLPFLQIENRINSGLILDILILALHRHWAIYGRLLKLRFLNMDKL